MKYFLMMKDGSEVVDMYFQLGIVNMESGLSGMRMVRRKENKIMNAEESLGNGLLGMRMDKRKKRVNT